MLGYGLYEPWAPRSNTKQDQFNKEANKRVEQFLRDILLPSLRSEFGIILGSPMVYLSSLKEVSIPQRRR